MVKHTQRSMDNREKLLELIHAFEDEHMQCIRNLGGIDPYRSERWLMKDYDQWVVVQGCRAGSFVSQLRHMLERLDTEAREVEELKAAQL